MVHYDGTAWSYVDTPSHPIGTSLLLGVAAAGPDLVWTVGSNDRGGPQYPFSIRYDGSDLTVFDPAQIGIGTHMIAVAVAPNGDAWTVGSYAPSAATPQRTLIMSWPGATVEGDLDGDGTVGILDFLALLAAWGPCPDPPTTCPADLDSDGTVGILDFLTLLGNWG